jgi:hypothetical protein
MISVVEPTVEEAIFGAAHFTKRIQSSLAALG